MHLNTVKMAYISHKNQKAAKAGHRSMMCDNHILIFKLENIISLGTFCQLKEATNNVPTIGKQLIEESSGSWLRLRIIHLMVGSYAWSNFNGRK